MEIIVAIFTINRVVWGFSFNFIYDLTYFSFISMKVMSLIQNGLHFKQAVFGLLPNELASACLYAAEERTEIVLQTQSYCN